MDQGPPTARADKSISYIVATKDRAHSISPCLDSIVAAMAKAAPVDVEIVMVDNGSTDNTFEIASAWARTSGVKTILCREPRPGKSAALNHALRIAKGDIFAFTDDDCRLHPNHINDLLAHDAADRDNLVLRSGRYEHGYPIDFPHTVTWRQTLLRWSRAENSVRHVPIAGHIIGANMVARRRLFEHIGLFDEDFGPGSRMLSGEDTELAFRAYTRGIVVEYVPNMTVYHLHGRQTVEGLHKAWRSYSLAGGGVFAKYLFKDPNLCRPFWWNIKNAAREVVTGTNLFQPSAAFSHRHAVASEILGVMRYVFMRKQGAPQPLDALTAAGISTSSAQRHEELANAEATEPTRASSR